MIIQGLTDGLLAVEEVVAAFLRVSLFAVLLVGIRICSFVVGVEFDGGRKIM